MTMRAGGRWSHSIQSKGHVTRGCRRRARNMWEHCVAIGDGAHSFLLLPSVLCSFFAMGSCCSPYFSEPSDLPAHLHPSAGIAGLDQHGGSSLSLCNCGCVGRKLLLGVGGSWGLAQSHQETPKDSSHRRLDMLFWIFRSQLERSPFVSQ